MNNFINIILLHKGRQYIDTTKEWVVNFPWNSINVAFYLEEQMLLYLKLCCDQINIKILSLQCLCL